jgi:type II secretion system protein J
MTRRIPEANCAVAGPIQAPRGAIAFTLLELLIAISIFGVVLAAINGVFYSALRLHRRAWQSVEDSLPVTQALAIFKRDLQGIIPPGGVLGGSLQSGTTTTTPGSPIPAGATTLYTCTGAIDDTSPWAEVQKVVYYLKDPESRNAPGRDLVRAVNRNLLPTTQEEFLEQWLMGGVQRLRMGFFDGASWRDTWDSTTPDPVTGLTNTLPRAIRIQIELAANIGEQPKAPVQLLVPVTIQVSTNQTQTAGATQ